MIYLNSANLSICPEFLVRRMNEYRLDFERNPTKGLQAAWASVWQSQTALARFLNTDPNHLFLRANVTAAFNSFLLGFHLPPRSEMLVGEHEYGAIVNICRLKAERENLVLRILTMPSSPVAYRALTSESLVARVVDQLSPNTSMVLLSQVIGGSGLVLPIETIGNEVRKRNIIFAVDASYAVGALSVDLSVLPVDFYGSSLYKFMKGPKGTAFGWVSPQVQEKLTPLEAGWTSFGPSENVCLRETQPFAERMFLKGCQDFAPYLAIEDLVNWWTQYPATGMRKGIFELNAKLQLKLSEKGLSCLLANESSLRGPMTAICSRKPTRELSDALWETHRIQVGTINLGGQGFLSVSPHIDTSEGELERFVDVLSSYD